MVRTQQGFPLCFRNQRVLLIALSVEFIEKQCSALRKVSTYCAFVDFKKAIDKNGIFHKLL